MVMVQKIVGIAISDQLTGRDDGQRLQYQLMVSCIKYKMLNIERNFI